MNDKHTAQDETGTRAETEMSSARNQAQQVFDDVRSLIHSELDYYKSRFIYSQKLAKWISLYLAIAIGLLIAAISAFILGILLIANSYLGPIFGMIFVSASTLILAVIFALLARKKSRDLLLPEIDKPANHE
jgi:uncharacterized protein YacL